MKEFAPLGSKFFPFSVDPFSEGVINNFDIIASFESASIPLTLDSPGSKFFPCSVDPFSEGNINILNRIASFESASP